MCFIIAMTIAFIFAAIFQCDKAGDFWVTSYEGKSNCVNSLILWCDLAVTFLVTNIWITVLPLPTLLGSSIALLDITANCFPILPIAGLMHPLLTPTGLHLSKRKGIMVISFLCSAGFV